MLFCFLQFQNCGFNLKNSYGHFVQVYRTMVPELPASQDEN